MAIVKMSKFDLVIFGSKRAEILKKLQRFKEVNFVDIKLNNNEVEDESGSKNRKNDEINGNKIEGVTKYVNNEELTHIEERLHQVRSAISLIKKYDERKTRLRDVIKGNENYTFDELYKKVLSYDWKKVSSELNDIGAQYANIKSRISKKYSKYDEIDLWERLDVNPKELKKLKKVNSYLGTVPLKLKGTFIEQISKLSNTYYEELKIVKDEVYYLVISLIEKNESEKLSEVFRNSSFTVANLDIDAVPQDYKDNLQKEISELKNEKEELIKYLAKKYNLCQNFKHENSCGAIVFNNKIKKFLIVKMFNGNWGFPKGHIEECETEVETAIREVFEETGIKINIVSDKKYEIKYVPNETTIKKVTFFIGITENEKVTVDEQEIEAYKWCSYEEALKTITYRLQKEVLENSYKILKQKNLESLEN